jgi:hypothetical protein
MTLYPHEWILQYKNVIIGLFIVGIVSWITGNIFWYIVGMTTPTTQTWTSVNVAQPTAFSYASIIFPIGLLITLAAVIIYFGCWCRSWYYDGEKLK